MIENVLAGPYGSLTSGLAVLAVELGISRLVRSESEPTVQQTVTGDGNVVIADTSRRITLVRLVTPRERRQEATAPRAAASASSMSDGDKVVAILTAGFFITLGLAAAAAKFHELTVNIALGAAWGTVAACVLLLLPSRHLVPVAWREITLTVLVAAVLTWQAVMFSRLQWEGTTLSDVDDALRGESWKSSMGILFNDFAPQVSTTFALAVAGLAISGAVCLFLLRRVTGLVIAGAALTRSQPRAWHLWAAQRLYPGGSWATDAKYATAVLVFSSFLVSGLPVVAADHFSHMGDEVEQSSGASEVGVVIPATR